MDGLEKLFDSTKQSVAMGGYNVVFAIAQEFDITDKMGKAELKDDIEVSHVLAIGGEVIATQYALELLAQHFDEHLGTSRLINYERGEDGSSEYPGPE